MKDGDKNATYWWLRTPEDEAYQGFYQVYPNGTLNAHGAQLTESVIAAFVIG